MLHYLKIFCSYALYLLYTFLKNPYVDEKDGKVRNTALLNTLYLKKNARVILTHNVDVSDGLYNGAKGIATDFLTKENQVTHVIVKLDKPSAGSDARKAQDDLFHCLYEGETPISRVSHSYSINKKQFEEGQKATCKQFPLAPGYAFTTHKVQGATYLPPKTITSDLKRIFVGGQYYTLLSRLQEETQLYLLNDLYENKIYATQKALKAL